MLPKETLLERRPLFCSAGFPPLRLAAALLPQADEKANLLRPQPLDSKLRFLVAFNALNFKPRNRFLGRRESARLSSVCMTRRREPASDARGGSARSVSSLSSLRCHTSCYVLRHLRGEQDICCLHGRQVRFACGEGEGEKRSSASQHAPGVPNSFRVNAAK